MIEIFAKCPNCGLSGRLVRRAMQLDKDTVVYKTGKGTDRGDYHLELLRELGVRPSYTTPVVLYEGKAELLKTWIISHS